MHQRCQRLTALCGKPFDGGDQADLRWIGGAGDQAPAAGCQSDQVLATVFIRSPSAQQATIGQALDDDRDGALVRVRSGRDVVDRKRILACQRLKNEELRARQANRGLGLPGRFAERADDSADRVEDLPGIPARPVALVIAWAPMDIVYGTYAVESSELSSGESCDQAVDSRPRAYAVARPSSHAWRLSLHAQRDARGWWLPVIS